MKEGSSAFVTMYRYCSDLNSFYADLTHVGRCHVDDLNTIILAKENSSAKQKKMIRETSFHGASLGFLVIYLASSTLVYIYNRYNTHVFFLYYGHNSRTRFRCRVVSGVL